MAGVRDNELDPIGPWPSGINNLADEGALPRGALREAVNVDLSPQGRPRRRPGYQSAYTGTLVHSAWSNPLLGSLALFVDDGQLMALRLGGTADSLGVTVGNAPLSFALIADRVYFSNRFTSGMLTLDLEAHAWSPEQPDGQPTLAAVTGYSLDVGLYQLAVTFVDKLGRESGSSLAAAVQVEQGGGITLDAIPQPQDLAQAQAIHVYLTGPNDAALKLSDVLPIGVTDLVIGQAAHGRNLATQLLLPLPAGHIVRGHNGRQFVAVDDEILWSEPMRYGLYNPVSNRLRGLPGRVQMMEPVGDGSAGAGVYVASGERTVFLAGADPASYTRVPVRSTGAVPGTSIRVPGTAMGLQTSDDVLVWLAQDGIYCIGLPGGQVVALKEGEAVTDGADSGATLFRKEAGAQRLITTLRGPRPQALAVRDAAIAHVIPT